jgi:fatty acid desaturase
MVCDRFVVMSRGTKVFEAAKKGSRRDEMGVERFPRDYSLSGPENAKAVAAGLANAKWYRTEIPRARMRELMQRSDEPATRDTILWVGGMIVTGALGAYFWGSWWCVPFFAVYGVLYGSGGDSRWHECGHGTAFKTQWKNDVVYQIACFFMIRNPTIWRWSHTRHHTDTIIIGRDPEIITPRPPNVPKMIGAFVGIPDVPKALVEMVRYARGKLTADERDFVPEAEQPRVAFVARVWIVIYALTLLACVLMRSILPLMLIGLPRIYGGWHHILTGFSQHIGLADDVIDHRLNSRTMYLNPFSRFVYWNMNYHVEHHMFPTVPYHALPALHEEMKADCPPPYRGFLDVYREMIPALIRQMRDPTYYIHRQLPPGAGSTVTPVPPGAAAVK